MRASSVANTLLDYRAPRDRRSGCPAIPMGPHQPRWLQLELRGAILRTGSPRVVRSEVATSPTSPARSASATAASTGTSRAKRRSATSSLGASSRPFRCRWRPSQARRGLRASAWGVGSIPVTSKRTKAPDDPELFATYVELARGLTRRRQGARRHPGRPARTDHRRRSVARCVRQGCRLRWRGSGRVRRHVPLPQSSARSGLASQASTPTTSRSEHSSCVGSNDDRDADAPESRSARY